MRWSVLEGRFIHLIISRNILVSVEILNSAANLLSNMLASYVSSCEIAGGPWLIECEVELPNKELSLIGDLETPHLHRNPPRATISNRSSLVYHHVRCILQTSVQQSTQPPPISICQATCTLPAVHHSTTTCSQITPPRSAHSNPNPQHPQYPQHPETPPPGALPVPLTRHPPTK